MTPTFSIFNEVANRNGIQTKTQLGGTEVLEQTGRRQETRRLLPMDLGTNSRRRKSDSHAGMQAT